MHGRPSAPARHAGDVRQARQVNRVAAAHDRVARAHLHDPAAGQSQRHGAEVNTYASQHLTGGRGRGRSAVPQRPHVEAGGLGSQQLHAERYDTASHGTAGGCTMCAVQCALYNVRCDTASHGTAGGCTMCLLRTAAVTHRSDRLVRPPAPVQRATEHASPHPHPASTGSGSEPFQRAGSSLMLLMI